LLLGEQLARMAFPSSASSWPIAGDRMTAEAQSYGGKGGE